MTLTTTFKVGGLTCHTLEGGRQKLDGGAMFGVVPKPLWEKEIAPDERNRIPLAMRCLLIEHSDGLILVDTALGNKESDKFKGIYGIENAGKAGPTQLEDALKELSFAPKDVRYVINTHLHFDHAGGNTTMVDGAVVLSFPNAAYVVQERELEWAMHTNERTAASYIPHNFVPLTEAKRWRFVSGEAEVLSGIRVIPTPGHVPWHQSIKVTDRGETALFLGDLVPTGAHLPLPWIMGYDVEPLVTLETKRRIFHQAEAEDWLMIFEHDPLIPWGRIQFDGKAYQLRAE